jgi:hypothetical protein
MQMLLVGLVGLGLLVIALGGVMINLGSNPTGPNPSLVQSYGPVAIDIGLFLFIGGLLLAALALENLDVFVRLFLMILAFVALLMILASPFTYFALH